MQLNTTIMEFSVADINYDCLGIIIGLLKYNDRLALRAACKFTHNSIIEVLKAE